MKLGKGDDKVKTAEDFLDGIASKSSFSASLTRFARLCEYDNAHP
jgi:hypothetical protein